MATVPVHLAALSIDYSAVMLCGWSKDKLIPLVYAHVGRTQYIHLPTTVLIAQHLPLQSADTETDTQSQDATDHPTRFDVAVESFVA